jgi:hypothetical protein
MLKKELSSSEKRAFLALKRLKCPSIRLAETSDNFVKCPPHNKTPDFISGPNNGNKYDFYIDVHASDGSMFDTDSPAHLSPMAEDLRFLKNELEKQPRGTVGRVLLNNYANSFIPEWNNPFENKMIHKYGSTRGSHLSGLVGIFDAPMESEKGFLIGTAFGTMVMYLKNRVECHFSTDQTNLYYIKEEFKEFLNKDTGNLYRFQIRSELNFAFYLLLGYGSLKGKGLLLINSSVVFDPEYSKHPTVMWLRRLFERPWEIRVPY